MQAFNLYPGHASFCFLRGRILSKYTILYSFYITYDLYESDRVKHH